MPKSGLFAALASRLGLFALLFAGSQSTSAAPPISVYGNLPGFEQASLSPSGNHVAVVGLIDGKRSLVVMDTDKKPRLVVGIDPATKVHGLFWAGDAMVLVETSGTSALGVNFVAEKAELYAMMVVPLDQGKPWSVFSNERMIRGGIRGFYGVDFRGGKYYGYFGGITWEGSTASLTNPALYEVDLQTRAAHQIATRAEGGYAEREWIVDNNGVASGTLEYFSNSGNWRINNAQKQRLASGVQLLGRVQLVGFGSTPNSLVYKAQDPDTGVNRMYEVPIQGGEPKEIAAGEEIHYALFDPRTRQLIGYELNTDQPVYKMFDPYQAKVAAAVQKAFPDHAVRLIDWNEAFNRLIVQTDGAGDAKTWWLVDIKSGAADVLGKSYQIPSKDVAPTRMIAYKAGDGTNISAVLTLPPGRDAANLPVIVFPHGGPTARDYPVFDWWSQALASQGYAVFQPNFRGSTGYGAAFIRAGDGEWGKKMQSDISDGLAEIAKQGIVDPKRACIVGGSYGGYAALAGVTLQQGLYRCAVSFAGIGDLTKMVTRYEKISGGDPTLIRALKEEFGSVHDLSTVSPIHFAARADAPILLIHGKDDTVVDYNQSSDMAAALRRANKPVEFVTLPETDHWLTRGDTRLAMLEATIAFVEKYNPPAAPKP